MSSFGKEVRVKLLEIERTNKWLAEEVNKKTGLFCDSAYLSKVLKGDRNPPRIIEAIQEILNMEG